MTRPPAPAIGLKVEAAMASAKINAELVCPVGTPSFPPGTHDFELKRHNLVEGVSKCMISREEAQAKFNEYHEAQGSHEVYTDGSKMNKAKWPLIYRSRSKVIICNTPSHTSDHLC